jgi:hypothetical protein
MSTYHCYRIGYIKDGKIYPLGPCDANGEFKYAVEKSQSFASDLYEDFYVVREEQISDELRKLYETTDWNGNKVVDVKYLPVDELPSGSFVKSGYFLIEDVIRYEKDPEAIYFDGFYNSLSPTVYAAMLHNEKIFGKPNPVRDEFDNEIQLHSASDYMFFAYPDYSSKEYEANIIREFANSLENYNLEKDGAKLVVLYNWC